MLRPLLAAAIVAFFAMLCADAPIACADDAAAKPSAEQLSLEGFAAATPSCLEWSDGCATCARGDQNAVHCSTPGIACQPGPIVCRKEK